MSVAVFGGASRHGVAVRGKRCESGWGPAAARVGPCVTAAVLRLCTSAGLWCCHMTHFLLMCYRTFLRYGSLLRALQGAQ